MAAPAAVHELAGELLGRVVKVEPGVFEKQASTFALGLQRPGHGGRHPLGVRGSPQLIRSRFCGTRSSTWHAICPENPVWAIGRLWKVKRCPTTGSKSLGISHCAINSGVVSARQSFDGECGK